MCCVDMKFRQQLQSEMRSAVVSCALRAVKMATLLWVVVLHIGMQIRQRLLCISAEMPQFCFKLYSRR